MTYEEKYKRAFEIAKEVYHDDRKDKIWREWLTKLFPELKVSEEERIRKWLIGYFQQYRIDGMGVVYANGLKEDDIIAWLERQGEKKPYEWHSEDEQNLNATLSYIDDEYLRRWLKDIIHAKYEQCGGCVNDKGCVTCVDDNMKGQKVEPKFKAGDWIIGNEGIFKISQYDDDGGYNLTDTTGCVVHFVSPNHVESNFHLWTIQDAKDGDVLYCKAAGGTEFIMVLKNITRHDILNSYCRYNSADGFRKNVSSVMSITDNPKPATKEQRDLLFQKMKEAAYEWDAEKKELKKVDTKFHEGDWCIDKEDGTIFQIVKVFDNTYVYKTNEGKEYSCTHYSLENDARLWAIQDAKDGDVLVCPSDLGDRMIVFIFKELVNHASEINCHCCIDACGIFDPCLNDCCYVGDVSRGDYAPATKEQRDLLFHKMRDSGHEWDSDKKVLKKIEVVCKESEDEKIRKGLINGFKECLEDCQYPKNAVKYWHNVEVDNILTWLENQGNVDKASYEIAEKEKYDFVSGQFIECRKSFNEFKEDNSYWFEYVGNDTYIGRSDNILNKKFHITPMQLYRLFTQQHCPKENDVNEETNAPTGYGKYVDECLYEAAEHFFSEGEDKYSVADLFYAGVRCGKSCLEKQDTNKEYLFRPLAGTTIETAVEQALEQGDVVLAFNGFYTPVKGKTSDEILTEYDHWFENLIEKQAEQKQTWKPTAAQLIVIKDLIEDKNTSKVNKTILRGMFDEFKQFTNGHKREIDDAKHEIEKAR